MTGVEAVARALARSEYAQAIVRSRAIWLKSMNTRSPRSSFHQAVVIRSGLRRSTSRASAIAARRTSTNVHCGWIRT